MKRSKRDFKRKKKSSVFKNTSKKERWTKSYSVKKKKREKLRSV